MMDIDLQIQHHFGKQVYVKQMHLPAGHVAQSHKHTFDHLSILAVGNALVEQPQKNTRIPVHNLSASHRVTFEPALLKTG